MTLDVAGISDMFIGAEALASLAGTEEVSRVIRRLHGED